VGDEVLFLHRLRPGGADRSYGIEVGRLAGLPSAVLTRARAILRLLEGGHLVASKVATTNVAGAVDQQLGLFLPGMPHPLLERLRALDTNAMTPLQALQALADLAREAREADE
jgi:DNA mismatch repair protein MutS